MAWPFQPHGGHDPTPLSGSVCVCRVGGKNRIDAQDKLPGNADLQEWVEALTTKCGPIEDWPHIGCSSKLVAPGKPQAPPC